MGVTLLVLGALGAVLVALAVFWLAVGVAVMVAAQSHTQYEGDRVPNFLRMWYNWGYFSNY